MECFGWCNIGVRLVKGCHVEKSQQCKACARRKVKDEWGDELATKLELPLLKLLKEKGGEPRCLDVVDKHKR